MKTIKVAIKEKMNTGAQFEGDLGEILVLGAKFHPILVSRRSGSLPKKKKKKKIFFFSFHLVSTP